MYICTEDIRRGHCNAQKCISLQRTQQCRETDGAGWHAPPTAALRLRFSNRPLGNGALRQRRCSHKIVNELFIVMPSKMRPGKHILQLRSSGGRFIQGSGKKEQIWDLEKMLPEKRADMFWEKTAKWKGWWGSVVAAPLFMCDTCGWLDSYQTVLEMAPVMIMTTTIGESYIWDQVGGLGWRQFWQKLVHFFPKFCKSLLCSMLHEQTCTRFTRSVSCLFVTMPKIPCKTLMLYLF